MATKGACLSVSFFRWGSLIPLKVIFQGLGGLLKSKLALYLWVFSKVGLMYHFQNRLDILAQAILDNFHHLSKLY